MDLDGFIFLESTRRLVLFSLGDFVVLSDDSIVSKVDCELVVIDSGTLRVVSSFGWGISIELTVCK